MNVYQNSNKKVTPGKSVPLKNRTNVLAAWRKFSKRKKREVYSSELGAVATDLKNPQKKYTIINMMLGAKYILTPLKYKRHGQKKWKE